MPLVLIILITITQTFYKRTSITLYLGFVPHGSFPQHGDLSASLLLQSLDGVPLRSKDLPNKVKLHKATEKLNIKLTAFEEIYSTSLSLSELDFKD